MTHISIVGTGNMGPAIAGLVTKGGNTVELIAREQDDVRLTGEIVVLAVPHSALQDIVATRADELAGKIVVDISNPLDFETFDGLTVPADSSAAEGLQAQLTASTVLKAFNTNFAGTLVSGALGGRPTTVLIAGDDQDAKAALTAVVTAAGLTAVDAGSLKRARELEAVGFLQLTLAVSETIGWSGGLALVK